VLAVLLALAASVAGASATASSKGLDRTITTDVTRIWNANSCCVVERVVDGWATIPSLGRLHATGTYDLVSHFVTPDPGLTGGLVLTLTARNGDSLTIGGSSDLFAFGAAPPASPWEVVSGTGRFAEAAGSGTYTVSGPVLDDTADTTPLSFAFEGTLAK